MEKIKTDHIWLTELVERIELLRSLSVFNSHFLEAATTGGRIHCSFNVAGTDTFRWSSSANGFGEGTNLQNIPKGSEE
jgi:DNA polymerase I-like protein with 3'-5' exonuclease and polymerase domains